MTDETLAAVMIFSPVWVGLVSIAGAVGVYWLIEWRDDNRRRRRLNRDRRPAA